MRPKRRRFDRGLKKMLTSFTKLRTIAAKKVIKIFEKIIEVK
jgi:hypothetical protein